jgi:type II secretory pathway component PulJ
MKAERLPGLGGIVFVLRKDERQRDKDNLEHLARQLESGEVLSPERRNWCAGAIRRVLANDYPAVGRHRPKESTRAQWQSIHYWLRKECLGESDRAAASAVAQVWSKAGFKVAWSTVRTTAERAAQKSAARREIARSIRGHRKQHYRGQIIAALLESCERIADELGSAKTR